MRRLLPLIALATLACGSTSTKTGEDSAPESDTTPKVLFVIAHDGFRDEELSRPRRILEDAGYRSVIASTDTSKAKGMLGASVTPDILISQARSRDYVALVLVGGQGARSLVNDTALHRLAREFNAQDKVIGAICLAPLILGRAGLLDNVQATCDPSAAYELERTGARLMTQDVVIVGRLVTASGPHAVRAFAKELVALLEEASE